MLPGSDVVSDEWPLQKTLTHAVELSGLYPLVQDGTRAVEALSAALAAGDCEATTTAQLRRLVEGGGEGRLADVAVAALASRGGAGPGGSDEGAAARVLAGVLRTELRRTEAAGRFADWAAAKEAAQAERADAARAARREARQAAVQQRVKVEAAFDEFCRRKRHASAADPERRRRQRRRRRLELRGEEADPYEAMPAEAAPVAPVAVADVLLGSEGAEEGGGDGDGDDGASLRSIVASALERHPGAACGQDSFSELHRRVGEGLLDAGIVRVADLRRCLAAPGGGVLAPLLREACGGAAADGARLLGGVRRAARDPAEQARQEREAEARRLRCRREERRREERRLVAELAAAGRAVAAATAAEETGGRRGSSRGGEPRVPVLHPTPQRAGTASPSVRGAAGCVETPVRLRSPVSAAKAAKAVAALEAGFCSEVYTPGKPAAFVYKL